MKIRPSSKQFDHLIANLSRQSAQHGFVKIRKKFCDYMASLNAIVLLPVCVDCHSHECHVFGQSIEPPDISEYTWKEDLAWEVGLTEYEIRQIDERIKNGGDIELRCGKCSNLLEYGKDNFYVESEPFSEYFSIPESTHRAPSKQLREEIIKLYGQRCYRCSEKLSKEDVTCDHIIARVHNGLTSSLNLQILCKNCNNKVKAGRKTKIINVNLTFLFRPPPHDFYEEVMW